jgi:hypothetical protein
LKKKSKKRTDKDLDAAILFGNTEQYILTLRIPPDVNNALDRYIARNTALKRQKKKTIVLAIRRFLIEKGEL